VFPKKISAPKLKKSAFLKPLLYASLNLARLAFVTANCYPSFFFVLIKHRIEISGGFVNLKGLT